jgi:hypothetical protein
MVGIPETCDTEEEIMFSMSLTRTVDVCEISSSHGSEYDVQTQKTALNSRCLMTDWQNGMRARKSMLAWELMEAVKTQLNNTLTHAVLNNSLII